ncbi:unnamed protein product [Paramecium primaurelia]|uniref:Tetratricopeptide repeat protein n=1 Tax=Paramecium primaurelia TaxID=5886 RepID=A0A8S1LVL3_PARPR|nr:unnamed protein product [Paramecium primaurelia]
MNYKTKVYLIKLFLMTGKLKITNLVKQKPNQLKVLQVYKNQGKQLMDLNKFDEAIQIYINILELDSKNIAALFGYGDTLVKLQQFQLALEQYRKIKKFEKDLIVAFLKIGLTLGQMGNIKQALKYFIKTQNEIMEDHKLEWTRNKEIEIKELLKQALQYFSNQNLTNEELLVYGTNILIISSAFILIRLNHCDEALQILNQIKDSNLNNDLLLCLEADILFVNLKFDEAEQTLKRTIKINPNRIYTWIKLTIILIIQGKYQEALSQLDNIILKAYPKNLDSICYRSDILRLLNKTQEAIVGYNQCISYNEKYLEAYQKKANTLRNLGYYLEALEIYDLLLQDDPKNYEMLFEKGCTMFDLKEYHTANQLFDQVLELSSNNVDALVKKGDILLVLGLFQDSLEIYEKVLSIKSNHFFALWGKSESLRGLRKFSESLIWYDKVLEQRQIYPYAYHYKGYALQQLDRHEEAINNFFMALSIIPGFKLSEEALQISKQKLKVQK